MKTAFMNLEPALKKLDVKLKRCGMLVHHYGKLNMDAVLAKGEEYYKLGKRETTGQ